MSLAVANALPCLKKTLPSSRSADFTPGPDDAPVVRDLGNGLLVLYVVDEGPVFTFVQRRHLREAGMDDDTLHRTALANLHLFLAERTQLQPYGPIFGLFLDGNFEASLLLVDVLWDKALSSYAPNGVVAAVPARDVLAFTDAANADGIAQLRAMIGRLFPGGDHLISQDLYRRVDGRWEPLP